MSLLTIRHQLDPSSIGPWSNIVFVVDVDRTHSVESRSLDFDCELGFPNFVQLCIANEFVVESSIVAWSRWQMAIGS